MKQHRQLSANNPDEMLVQERITKVSNKINQIKTIISGRNVSFTDYTHTSSRHFRYSPSKTDDFVATLVHYIAQEYEKNEETFTSNLEELYTNFFHCVVLYCDISCRKEDLIFESFIKLAATTSPDSPTGESIFDILVRNQEQQYPEESAEFHPYYQNFKNLYSEAYHADLFESDIHLAINSFLDEHSIGYYMDDALYDEAISILDGALHELLSLRY